MFFMRITGHSCRERTVGWRVSIWSVIYFIYLFIYLFTLSLMFTNYQLILKDNTSYTKPRIMYANLCQPWPTILRCVNQKKY